MLAYPVGFLTINISPIVLIVFLVIACVTMLARGLFLPRRFPATACCGRCKYEISFDAPRCPECGSDLRVVGTITARTALMVRSSLALLVLAWTVLAVCGLELAMQLSFDFVKPVQTRTVVFSRAFRPFREHHLVKTEGRMRASAPNYELVLSGAYVENVWGEFVLRIEPKSGPRVRVSIDTDSRAWEYRADGAPAEGSNLDADAIACFFEAAQIDTDSTSIELEIGQIVDVLDLILAVGPEDAERQKWGLPDSFMKHPVYRQQPVSTLPAMSRMSRYSKNDNVTATFETKEWDTPVDLSADVQYTHGENNRPKLLTALTIRVHNEIGWPLEIQSHPPTQSWTASMNNEQWATGSLPVSELEVLELLRRQGIAAGILEAADLVADVAALVNVDDSQLIELTNWAPPTDWKRPTEGLAAGIGNSSVSVIASRSFSQYVQFVVLVGLAVVVWIAGLWCIHRRRRSLLRLSDAAPV